jgi:hypothetical protein
MEFDVSPKDSGSVKSVVLEKTTWFVFEIFFLDHNLISDIFEIFSSLFRIVFSAQIEVVLLKELVVPNLLNGLMSSAPSGSLRPSFELDREEPEEISMESNPFPKIDGSLSALSVEKELGHVSNARKEPAQQHIMSHAHMTTAFT